MRDRELGGGDGGEREQTSEHGLLRRLRWVPGNVEQAARLLSARGRVWVKGASRVDRGGSLTASRLPTQGRAFQGKELKDKRHVLRLPG